MLKLVLDKSVTRVTIEKLPNIAIAHTRQSSVGIFLTNVSEKGIGVNMAKQANSCRDCKRCTESLAAGVVKAPVRVVLAAPNLLVRAFQRKCPHCGHPLSWHGKDDAGRFKD